MVQRSWRRGVRLSPGINSRGSARAATAGKCPCMHRSASAPPPRLQRDPAATCAGGSGVGGSTRGAGGGHSGRKAERCKGKGGGGRCVRERRARGGCQGGARQQDCADGGGWGGGALPPQRRPAPSGPLPAGAAGGAAAFSGSLLPLDGRAPRCACCVCVSTQPTPRGGTALPAHPRPWRGWR